MITEIKVYSRLEMQLVASGIKEIPYKEWNLISIYSPTTPPLFLDPEISLYKSLPIDSRLKNMQDKGCKYTLSLAFDDVLPKHIEILSRAKYHPDQNHWHSYLLQHHSHAANEWRSWMHRRHSVFNSGRYRRFLDLASGCGRHGVCGWSGWSFRLRHQHGAAAGTGNHHVCDQCDRRELSGNR